MVKVMSIFVCGTTRRYVLLACCRIYLHHITFKNSSKCDYRDVPNELMVSIKKIWNQWKRPTYTYGHYFHHVLLWCDVTNRIYVIRYDIPAVGLYNNDTKVICDTTTCQQNISPGCPKNVKWYMIHTIKKVHNKSNADHRDILTRC
jgi:hypothetical protein